MIKRTNFFNKFPVLEITEETIAADKRCTAGHMSFNRWLRREREKTLNKLPNEFRMDGKHNYDDFIGD